MEQSVSLVAALPETRPESELASASNPALWAIVFAGGIGSRFWPLSTPRRPKQLLALVDDRPLIADTLRRLDPIVPPERVVVVTSHDIAGAIHAAIPEVPESNMLVEPHPLGTSASLALALAAVKRRAGPDALVCGAHADLAISFLDLFHASLLSAAAVAQLHDRIVLLGIRPTRADESFGYALPGRSMTRHAPQAGALNENDLFEVRRFIEKPAAGDAASLIDAGALWYSGIFVGSVRTIQRELNERTPEVSAAMRFVGETQREEFIKLAKSTPLEVGLFERSDALCVLRGEFDWDDVGTWASLRRARELDDAGNGIIGEAYLVDSTANVVHSENGAVVLYGVSNLLVVRLGELTFVTTLDRARDLRPLLEELPPELRRRVRG